MFRRGGTHWSTAFLFAQTAVSSSAATLCMIVVMLPFFLLAMYERHGQPLEVIAGQMIQAMFIRPKERLYQTNNFYAAIARQNQVEKEVRKIVQKSRTAERGGPGKGKAKAEAAEKREIRKIMEAAKGDGKPHSAQDTLPFRQMYPDGSASWTIRPGAGASSLRM